MEGSDSERQLVNTKIVYDRLCCECNLGEFQLKLILNLPGCKSSKERSMPMSGYAAHYKPYKQLLHHQQKFETRRRTIPISTSNILIIIILSNAIVMNHVSKKILKLNHLYLLMCSFKKLFFFIMRMNNYLTLKKDSFLIKERQSVRKRHKTTTCK